MPQAEPATRTIRRSEAGSRSPGEYLATASTATCSPRWHSQRPTGRDLVHPAPARNDQATK